jgi:hypothetical protein
MGCGDHGGSMASQRKETTVAAFQCRVKNTTLNNRQIVVQKQLLNADFRQFFSCDSFGLALPILNHEIVATTNGAFHVIDDNVIHNLICRIAARDFRVNEFGRVWFCISVVELLCGIGIALNTKPLRSRQSLISI